MGTSKTQASDPISLQWPLSRGLWFPPQFNKRLKPFET